MPHKDVINFEYRDFHNSTIISASEDAYTHGLRINKIRRNYIQQKKSLSI